MTRRVAVVGIDGAGKSSIMARLRELAPDSDRSGASGAAVPTAFASMTCPDFHNTRDVPCADLSRQLKAFSVGCDEVGGLEMKAVAMYLQMTLFGPVERHFLDTFAPEVLVFERHPLVELLVYGPLYTQLARPQWRASVKEAEIEGVLERHAPGTFADIRAWHRAEAARLGASPDLWSVLDEVADLVGRDTAQAVAAFGHRFRTTLPDAVLWLDAPPEQAAARCVERSGSAPREAHETAQHLTALREGYLRVQRTLAEAFPHVTFHRIDTGDGADLERSVRDCVTEGKLFG
ncbi:hypothetical protein IU469_31820 [Nocardia puris]|uniref:Thymidylate kinase n=1 Tax=Nocardia puris TaxID=208602 RepID=A0A366CUU6_9NOCA|nr:hypothetical protein [Nocardia puris]MBF6370260.1 hypothetical protein [Nocardia puris]RBO80095.1 hypothetical protein DFR74_12812 [Nocardia puris]